MRLKILILIALTVACEAAIALQFNERIEVDGGGNLYARTDTDAAKDQVNGTGSQNYTRVLNLQKTATTLKSEYILSSNLSGGTNHYYAQMNSPDGLEHFVSIYADSDIKSVSTITQVEDKVSSDYSIESKSATLSEGITDSSDGKTRKEIAETEISGSFNLKSKLADDGEMAESPSSFDPRSMMEKLESADMVGETGRIDVTESETEVFLVGELKTTVKSVPSTNLTTPDGITDRVVEGNNTKTEYLPDGTEGETETFGTVIHEDEEEVIIVGETNVTDTAEEPDREGNNTETEYLPDGSEGETETFGTVIHEDEEEVIIAGTAVGVPDKAEELEYCPEGGGIKEIDGRRIAFIGYRPRTPLGWNIC